MSDTTIYIGAYAIVRVPQRTIEKSKRRCSRNKIHNVSMNDWVYFCPQCGAKVDSEPYSITTATTLHDLEEEGKLEVEVIKEGEVEVSKYHSISYSINHVDVDEPFLSEPLLLVSNYSDDGTRVTSFDPDDGDVYPWDVLISDIRSIDIECCTANFIRLYFKELSAFGETTVHFGILRDVEV